MKKSKPNIEQNEYVFEDEIVKGVCFNTGAQFVVDYDDYLRICEYRWKENLNGWNPYVCSKIDRKWVYLHRFITNAGQNEYVDHIDRNTLNNRKCNLRKATNQQNAYNSKVHRNNTSGFVGVYWSQKDKRWVAEIRHQRQIYLGSFLTKEEAIVALLKAELKCIGNDFAPQRHVFWEYGIGNISKLS